MMQETLDKIITNGGYISYMYTTSDGRVMAEVKYPDKTHPHEKLAEFKNLDGLFVVMGAMATYFAVNNIDVDNFVKPNDNDTIIYGIHVFLDGYSAFKLGQWKKGIANDDII